MMDRTKKVKKVKIDFQIVDSPEDIPENLTEDDPIYLDKDTFNELVTMAKEKGVTVDEMVEDVFRHYIEKAEKQVENNEKRT
jgi:hypothetical protein